MTAKVETSDQFRAATGVSRETAERLQTHLNLLRTWSARFNLVGPRELEHYWSRHALDSAQLIRHAQGAKTWLDLGAGAGFPGLVIAICLEECRVDLVERSAKKAAFLNEAIRETGARARVLAVRVEDLKGAGVYDVVTARAFAPLPRLIAHAKPWLACGAMGLFPKGADYASELAAAGFPETGGRSPEGMAAELLGSMSDPAARIVRIQRVGAE